MVNFSKVHLNLSNFLLQYLFTGIYRMETICNLSYPSVIDTTAGIDRTRAVLSTIYSNEALHEA